MIRFVAASLLCAACGSDRAPEREQPESVVHAAGVEADDVSRRLDGQSVRVAGEVRDVLTDSAFVVDDSDFFPDLIGEDGVVVVASRPIYIDGMPVIDERSVVIRGVVRTRVADVERAIGRRLPAKVVRAIGSRPVVVAREVNPPGEVGWANTDNDLQ